MKPENGDRKSEVGDRKLEKGNDGRMEFWKCADKQADKVCDTILLGDERL